jgi:hypothetical protein
MELRLSPLKYIDEIRDIFDQDRYVPAFWDTRDTGSLVAAEQPAFKPLRQEEVWKVYTDAPL